MIRTLALLFAFLITGCASTQIPPEVEKKIRTVAIVTLVPEAAPFQKVGLSGFNNEKSEIDMQGLVESTVSSTIRRRLSFARPQWTVKEISYDRPLLIREINGSKVALTYHEERIEKELAELASINQLDALLVINKQSFPNKPGDGVGVYLGTVMSTIQLALVHSHVSLTLVGANGIAIAFARGLSEDPKQIDHVALRISYEMRENIRADLFDRLRPEMADHLRRSINKRLDQLNLR